MDDNSATHVLIRTMEEFGQSEPTAVLVIFVCEDGSVKYSSNIDGAMMKLGMLEFAKALVLNRVFSQ